MGLCSTVLVSAGERGAGGHDGERAHVQLWIGGSVHANLRKVGNNIDFNFFLFFGAESAAKIVIEVL